MPEMAKSMGDHIPSVGDGIIAIQGKEINSLEELANIYQEIEFGDKVSLTLTNEDGEYKVVFEKTNQQNIQRKIIKKDN